MLPLMYHWRSLQVRQMRTLATLSCVAVSVGVFCYLMCFARGLRRAFARTGDPQNIIVLADGASAEGNSAITPEQYRQLLSVPGIARGSDGRPCISPEVVVQTDIERGGPGGRRTAVPVRGIMPRDARSVHRHVKLTSGRWLHDGSDELIAGVNAASRFDAVRLGAKIECGQRTFTVVGLFRAGGGAHEAELWGYLSNVAAAYRRSRYSSVTIRLDTPNADAVAAAMRRIADSTTTLRGLREADYYTAQSKGAAAIEGLAAALVIVMGVGVSFAAMNCMHASISGRTREFAMMQAIGFSPRRIGAGVLAESVAIAIAGGLAGCAACALVLVGGPTHDFGTTATFTSVAFIVELSGAELVYSLGIACAIGFVGGIWPAWDAARTRVIRALRAS